MPDGIYMVNTEASVTLKSDMTLKLSTGAILKAIPTRSERHSVLSIAGASNVAVLGGTLEGERAEHLGQSGEWGMGISIVHGAHHVTISGVTSKKMWGDGFYVQGATDVAFCSVSADDNRRQGLSVIEVDGLEVIDSVFKNTRGTRPSSGIDLEPDRAAQKITNVQIHNSEFLDNTGAAILVDGGKGSISNVKITGNSFAGTNKLPIKIKHAPAILPSAICDNRQIRSQEPSGGLFAFADLIAWMRPSTSLNSPVCKSRLGSDLLVETR